MSLQRISMALLALAPVLASCNVDRSAEPADIPPQFITFGSIDTNNTYSNTGAFIVRSNATGLIYPICSGTLIAPTVFLTASHCTIFYQVDLAADYTAFVSFDNPIPFGPLTSNTTKLVDVQAVVPNPAYSQRQSESGDIGVLVLDARDTRGIPPAVLPAQGLLDQLAAAGTLQHSTFTAVGYGVQDRVVGGGVPYFQDLNPIPRMYSFSAYNSLGPGYLRLSQNPARGNGGTCYGDSGGPNFLEVNGVQTLVASTVTGDNACRSTNVVYRLDTAAARSFLDDFVVLP